MEKVTELLYLVGLCPVAVQVTELLCLAMEEPQEGLPVLGKPQEGSPVLELPQEGLRVLEPPQLLVLPELLVYRVSVSVFYGGLSVCLFANPSGKALHRGNYRRGLHQNRCCCGY